MKGQLAAIGILPLTLPICANEFAASTRLAVGVEENRLAIAKRRIGRGLSRPGSLFREHRFAWKTRHE